MLRHVGVFFFPDDVVDEVMVDVDEYPEHEQEGRVGKTDHVIGNCIIQNYGSQPETNTAYNYSCDAKDKQSSGEGGGGFYVRIQI